MAVVKLNNDIRELELKEEEEIQVILSTLSAQVAEHLDTLRYNLENMVALDFYLRTGFPGDGTGRQSANLQHGRKNSSAQSAPSADRQEKSRSHRRDAGEDFDLLIITGPNTGGKTVSLKTVGLLTLMASPVCTYRARPLLPGSLR